MINYLGADNLLSFKELSLHLGTLNILIGPNGAGKSNLISALALAQSATTDIMAFMRANGGAMDWLYKGKAANDATGLAISLKGARNASVHYHLGFVSYAHSIKVIYERVCGANKNYYEYKIDRVPRIRKSGGTLQPIQSLQTERSILAQRRDPDLYPQLAHLADTLSSIRLYRDWRLGRYAPMRQPQPADLPTEYLLEDGSNLALILNRISRSEVRGVFLENLRAAYDDIIDFDISVEGNSVQVFFKEVSGLIPAPRLSDGTLRWLCLLCILLHPTPPPLVCIEEPELGLHPDLLPTLSRLLIEASERMQLIITTHSDSLLNALTDKPDAVIVCDKVDGATQCRRLPAAKLKKWLKTYSLGALWRTGEIGGNRW